MFRCHLNVDPPETSTSLLLSKDTKDEEREHARHHRQISLPSALVYEQ